MGDIGFEHTNRLGISLPSDYRAFLQTIRRRFGKELEKETDHYLNEVGKLPYDFKNRSYEFSMYVSGSFDANIVREACNWIFKNKDKFGSTILEVGCDCGFMTTFLGTLFPESRITAIDRNDSSIAIAKKNVELFGLTNVEFKTCDLMDLDDVIYDTVFSMRTVHENATTREEPNSLDDFKKSVTDVKTVFHDYATKLASVCGGNIISVERLAMNPAYAAWHACLFDCGYCANLDSFETLKCFELEARESLSAVVFEKGDTTGDCFSTFYQCFEKELDLDQESFIGWDANIMLQHYLVDVIEEKRFKCLQGDRYGIRVVIGATEFDDTVLYYVNKSGNAGITFYSADDIEYLKGLLKQTEIEVFQSGAYF